jgi:hypothetical protein
MLKKDMPKNLKPNLDLPDSADDKKHLKQEETIIDLPDVKDIPGQENIKVPPFKEFVDTTASSAGEEGDGLFDDQDGLEDQNDKSSVTPSEKALLKKSASQNPDDESELDVKESSLDRTDEDGAPLNEGDLLTDRFGEDLDLPESEEVDEEE